MSERALGVLATRFATSSSLVCLLQRTTRKTPKSADNSMVRRRNDAGRDAGTMIASTRPRRDLNGGAGARETSSERCGCEARAWTV